MTVALMGSVDSSWSALEGLLEGGVEVTCALGVAECVSHRISGYRNLEKLARRAGLPYHPFIKVSEPGLEDFLRAHPADVLWVVGLSQLVPDPLINLHPAGGLGFHPTLLPEGRGRAPIAWTILRNTRAGVSLFRLTREPDAGDLIAQREVPVLPDDYSEDLCERVCGVLKEVVLELAPGIQDGNLPAAPQDHSRATYYPKRTPKDGKIDWEACTDHIYRLIRAAGRPYPGAFTCLEDTQVTVWRGRPAKGVSSQAPGTVLEVSEEGVLVASGDGQIWLTEIEERGSRGANLKRFVRPATMLGKCRQSRW